MIESGEYWKKVNPFKKYVKRRSGRVGQRFKGAIVEIETQTVAYSGDLQLLGWADTEKGKTVRFWLDEEAERHPFAGFDKRSAKPGTLFVTKLVLIDDDESPIDEKAEERVSGGKRISQSIYIMLHSALFIQFMNERSNNTASLQAQGLGWDTVIRGESMIKKHIKRFLKIESLSDIDRDPELQRRFDEEIARPFRRWVGKGKER